MTLVGHQSFVSALQIEDNNLVLLSASKDRKVKVWNLQTGELVRDLAGHADSVHCLQCMGDTLYSASDDGAIRQWCMLFY